MLADNLVGDIPWQDQNDIRPVFDQGFRRENRDTAAWKKFALLGRGGVTGIGEQIPLNTRVVEQGVALRGRTVCGNLLPLPFHPEEKRQKLILDLIRPGLESIIEGAVVQSGFCLPAQEGIDGWTPGPAAGGPPLGIDP